MYGSSGLVVGLMDGGELLLSRKEERGEEKKDEKCRW